MKEKIAEAIGAIFGFLGVLFLIYISIAGIIHSIMKHDVDDTIDTILLPPLAWYRSVELWWHEDNSEVDWEWRKKTDIEACMYFFIQATNNEANKYELNRSSEKFRKEIEKYPSEYRQYLIDFSRKYLQYSESLLNDFYLSICQLESGRNYSFGIGDQTKLLKSQLSVYGVDDKLEQTQKGFEDISTLISGAAKNENFYENRKLIQSTKMRMEAMKSQIRNEISEMFMMIFNEKL